MKKIIVILVALTTTMGAWAQKLSGDITPLKGQKKVNVVLDFSGTLVNGKAETKYIAEEIKGKTEAEKEKWLTEWNVDLRANTYSVLVKDLNKAVSGKFFSVGEFPDAEYTILIKVKEITTGFFAGFMGKASAVQVEVRFVKTGGKNPIATVEYKKVSCKISDVIPHFVTRITMSFGTLGDKIGEIINKNLKK